MRRLCWRDTLKNGQTGIDRQNLHQDFACLPTLQRIAYIESSEAAQCTRPGRLYIYLLTCLRETGRNELLGEGSLSYAFLLISASRLHR